jgi:hypothetical protein
MLQKSVRVLVLGAACAASVSMMGCNTPPPPPRVAVPLTPEDGGQVKTYPHLRPLRQATPQELIPPPEFDDAPLVNQAVPEEPAYVKAHNNVGRPKLVVVVNRSLGSATDGYLAPGQYDEAQAKSIDYQAIELVLTDLLSANGKVTLQSANAAKPDADVQIQVQARPTKQTPAGLEFRILVEAVNTSDGESIARAFVDVPPPLDKTKINKYARLLARKTMAGTANAWTSMSSEPAPAPKVSATPMPAPAPTPAPLPLAPPTTRP